MTISPTDSLFDIAHVPFSTFGSWIMIGVPQKDERVFLRNCHNGHNNVFPLTFLAAGEPVQPVATAQPWRLVFSHEAGRVEVCFESTGSLRFRGQGLSLILGDRHLIYSEDAKRAVINERPALRRYQLEVLHGAIELEQLVPTQPVYPKRAIVSPAADGGWELAIDEFLSTWTPRQRGDFDACVAASRAAFEAFRDTMPPAREQDARARDLAAYVNWSCAVEPCGLIKRPALFMSKNWMCNVWSWDQCFNAMALSAGQPDLALDQMLTLVDHQDEFGCYPDSVNDVVLHFNFSKPPVHGWTLSEMLKRLPKRPDHELLATLYESLSAQARWWLTHRRLPGHRLPYYLHGNDSGWDNSTMFSQGVPLVAPDLAALLVLQMDVLADLAAELVREADWRSQADALYQALIDELWRGDHFVARHGVHGTDIESESLIPHLPIILGDRLPASMQARLRDHIARHLTDWGLSTEHVDSPLYRGNGYWRGPIWAPSTYIAVAGLDRCGFHELADRVAERFCRLCGTSGFAENFDAVTGEPLCDKAYTWTASVFLLLAERQLRRG